MDIRASIAEERVDQPVVGDVRPASGDDERVAAFERLASEHLDDSYRLARAILGRHGDAEDAVHDAFETAWRKWSGLRDASRFRPWFGRIVVNTCRDRLRRTARQRTEPVDEALPGRDPYTRAPRSGTSSIGPFSPGVFEWVTDPQGRRLARR